jgi:VanZ family protein
VGPDKFLHLVGHAGYAVALAEAFEATRCPDREAALLAVGVSTLLSLVTGGLQKRVPGRSCEPADVVAGLIGSVLAALGWYALADSRT